MYDAFPILRDQLPHPADLEAALRGREDFLMACKNTTETEPQFVQTAMDFAHTQDGQALLDAIFGNSPFLTQCLLREPSWLGRMCLEGTSALAKAVIDETRDATHQIWDEAGLMRVLRVHKRRIALTAAIGDITGNWSLYEVTEALSDFADAAASVAASYVIRRAADRGAFVLKDTENPERGSGYIIIGMGKLGARELNYSSDIDLICLFDGDAIETDNRDGLQQHTIRMTRTLARILDERTADGYVFRVDLRLRPDPGSTPLAISVLAAETYYESLGQNWERAAMIKARPIAGDLDAGNDFIDHLRPFVWRKNLDFAAIQDIHSIKRQIHTHKGGGEVAINGHNIKIGRGGIREIEFFAQTQQLIWGGREPSVRAPRTLDAIQNLVSLEQVDPTSAKALEEAYEFLRKLEHRLQMQRDEQTQTLPTSDEEIDALGKFFGIPDAAHFRADLLRTLGTVSHHYGDLFDDAPSLATSSGTAGNLSFTGVDSDPETIASLSELGFSDPRIIDKSIRGWHHGHVRATRSNRARELLTELTPTLLTAIGRQPNPDATFLRFESFVSGLPAGIQLFSMFQAYPNLLNLLAEIMGEAPRLAAHLSRRPYLLDSVLNSDFYEPLPDIEILRDDCAEALTDAQFFEDVLDATRRWNNDRRFQIGVQLLRGVVSAGDTARHFSDVAEAVVQTLFPVVISEFEKRYGVVPGGAFCALALGKLGSRELTPSSDLDLIFIYDAEEQTVQSDGERPLPASQYYGRLGQRLINAVMSMTAEGTLYEIDMRLRPSGNKGPLSTSIDGFQRYYDETAWTWEHMALVRARSVFDVNGLGERVTSSIHKTLCGHRDTTGTAKAVAHMRGRIEKQFGTNCIWSIKQVPGGQVDVDFLAQFLVLTNATKNPEIISANTITIFDVARTLGALSTSDADLMSDAKVLYRELQTFLALTIEGELTDATVDTFSLQLKRDLSKLTGHETFDALTKHLTKTEIAVRKIFENVVGDPYAPLEDKD